MAVNLRGFLRSLLDFPNRGSFFSLRGFVVSFGGLLLLVLAYRLLRALGRLLLRPWRRRSDENYDRNSAVACYRRLVQILDDIGLKRPPAETPREFATRSAAVLASRGPQTRSFAELPGQIVDVFYQIRFGARELPKEKLALLEDQLDALEAGLRPQT